MSASSVSGSWELGRADGNDVPGLEPEDAPMTKDHARLTVLLDAAKKKEFDELCAALGTNASQVVRELILHYLASGHEEPNLLSRAMAPKGNLGRRGTD